MKVINRAKVIDYLKEYKDLFDWDNGGRERAVLTRALKEISNMPYKEAPLLHEWIWNHKEYNQDNAMKKALDKSRKYLEETKEYIKSLEQAKCERDLAVKQLKDLGYGLGEKPRVGKWIKDKERFGDDNPRCSQCGAVLEKDDLEWRNNYYCYHCGAKNGG